MTVNDFIINPFCNIVVGFKNKKLDNVRTKYIVFDLPEQNKIIQCLLSISHKKLKNNSLDHLDSDSIDWLIKYGFLKKAVNLTLKQRLQRFSKNWLNENRSTVYTYKNTKYNVTSYVFMALTAKKGVDFIKDRIILPYWSKKLSQIIFDSLTSHNPMQELRQLSAKIIKKMLAKGLLIKKQDDIYYRGFCQKYCLLDQNIIEYIPKDYADNIQLSYSNTDIHLNTHLIWQEGAALHPLVASKVMNQTWISSNLPTLWIVNPNFPHILYPFWLTEKDARTLRKLSHAEITLEQLSNESKELFLRADILISDSQQNTYEIEWQNKIISAKDQLNKLGYFSVNDILPPVQLALWRKYARSMLENKLFLHDRIYGGTKKRFWQHNDGLTYFIQEQIGDLIGQITGNKVKPASAALTIYQPGGELPKHKDDIVAYSYVMSLVIDTQPETSRDDAWSLCVLEKGVEYRARMRMGDGMVIDPQSLHWRPGMLENHMLTIMILWYVPENYVGYINGKWIA